MKVAIVILNWNDAPSTLTCLASVKAAISRLRPASAANVIIVDNGSTPSLKELAPSLNQYSNVTLVESTQNLGFAGGMNKGLETAFKLDPDVVWLLNNDVIVESNSLAALCDFKFENPDKLCIGVVMVDQATGKVQTLGGYRYYTMWGLARPIGKSLDPALIPKAQPSMDYVDGAALFLDATKLREIGGIPTQNFLFYEELNLAYALGGKSALALCADAIVKHKGGVATKKLDLKSKTYFSTLAALRYTQQHLRLALPIVFCLRLALAVYRGATTGSAGNLRNVIAAGRDFLSSSKT